MSKTWNTSLPSDSDMIAAATALKPALVDHSRLARLVAAACPGLVLPELNFVLLQDCLRYVGAGPDHATQIAIQSGTVKSFLYLVHEAVELRMARACLDKPRPKGFRRDQGTVGLQDLWRANFSNCYSAIVLPADTEARAVEAQAEASLMHLYYGRVVSPAACVATLDIGTSEFPDAVENVRSRVLTHLGAEMPSPQECERARQGRNLLYGELLENVQTHFSNVERTAYAIFQARGEIHGHDLTDWIAARDAVS